MHFHSKFLSCLFNAGIALAIFSHVAHAQSSTQDSTLPETTVTATRFEEPYVGQPANVTVITADEIRNSTAQTLPELLSAQAGITTHDLFGNNATDATVDMRGFGATGGQNTLILIDGRRLTNIDLGGVNWSAFPLASIDHIEIERGGAVLYGDGATAGVINIVTRNPIGNPNSATVGVSAGSLGTYEEHLIGNVAGEHVGLNFTVDNFKSKGYRDNDTERQQNGNIDLRWQSGGSSLILKAATDSQGVRLPGARTIDPDTGENQFETDPRGTSTPNDWAQTDGNRISLDFDQKLAFGEFIIGGGYRDKEGRSYYYDSGYPIYTKENLNVWSILPRLKITEPIGNIPNELIVGLDYYRWGYGNNTADAKEDISTPVSNVNAHQTNRAFYLQDTANLTSLTKLSLGGRTERYSIDGSNNFNYSAPGSDYILYSNPGSPTQSTKTAWAADADLRQSMTDKLSANLRAERSFRFSNVEESYQTLLVDPNTYTYESSFSILKPQVNKTIEASLEWLGDRTAGKLTIFQTNVQNEIHLDSYDFGLGNTNYPDSRRRGVELNGKWQALDNVALTGAYSWTQAKFLSGVLPGVPAFGGLTDVVIADKTVPLVPTAKANAGIAWTIVPHLQWSVDESFTSSQWMDSDEGNLAAKIPSYWLANMELAYTDKQWRVSATVQNLFNHSYYNYAVRSVFSDAYSVYPLPGRTVRATVEYTFQ